jgi:spore coat protein CotH
LPVIYIETQDTAPIESREEYVNMKIQIVSDNPEHCLKREDFKDRIRGRGNYTWIGFPKKPYRIKFDSETSLFGFTEAENYVLLANYRDPTLLANTVAFELGQRFRLPFTNNYVHVELVLNGKHQGSYLLTEQVQVGKGSVDIDKNDGYLVEIDRYYDDDPKFKTLNIALPVMIKSPNFGKSLLNYQFVVNSLNEFDAVLSARNFPSNNYHDLIDMDTFVDYIMINEIVRNDDIGHPSNIYIYKDIGTKMKAGPLWDFECAFGLWKDLGIDISEAEGRLSSGFLNIFFNDPAFVARYKERWNEKFADILSIVLFIDEMQAKLRASQQLDNELWHRTSDYRQEVDNLKTFYIKRIIYLNEAINGK